MLEELEALATGRQASLFQSDVEAHRNRLQDSFKDRRLVVIGAAGSIGSSVVKQLLRCEPSSIALLDLSENNLTELVRDLRSTDGLRIPSEFNAIPIGLGSVEFTRFFAESPPFDYIFNLSALKHVRSEKNVYSLIRMIETNIVLPHEFLKGLSYSVRKVFSVSSDKAANPANLMGASKMVMEEMLLLHAERHPVSSARFANVAFSDGSLPFGFLRRLDKRQPLSAPEDVRRYFISHQEAGELCVLSAALGDNGEVFFPKMDSRSHAVSFPDIAVRLLSHFGYEPVLCSGEEEAKGKAKELIPGKRWPCYFFRSDTTGEKDLEEFYCAGDPLDLERFKSLGVIRRTGRTMDPKGVMEFLAFVENMKQDPRIGKPDIVKAFRKIVPGLVHVETGTNLDQKM